MPTPNPPRNTAAMQGQVIALARSNGHTFSKGAVEQVLLVAGLGVEGDAHAGKTVQHLSRIAADPGQPNLRQVHLLHRELLEDLRREGFDVAPGQLGENITTSGLDLLALPRGTVLTFASAAQVRLTGLRNPCKQIEAFRPGLLARLARKRGDGSIERLAGVMSVVLNGGPVQVGDTVTAQLPATPHQPLAPV